MVNTRQSKVNSTPQRKSTVKIAETANKATRSVRAAPKRGAKNDIPSETVADDGQNPNLNASDNIPSIELASALAALTQQVQVLQQGMNQLAANQSSGAVLEDPNSEAESVISGQSNNVPVNFQLSTNEVPRFSPGMLAGDNVTPTMQTKIWTHVYIELFDLLYPSVKPSYSMTMREVDDNNQFLLTPKNRRLLSEVEWGMAFDIYIAVYTKKYPEQLPALLTYSRQVKDLMKYRANWRFYDEEYRRSRQFQPHPWSVIRQDLELRAFRPNSQHMEYSRATPPGNTSEAVPKGYCFAYHRKGATCQKGDSCRYKHQCPKCEKKHPVFFPCKGTDQPSSSQGDKP